MSVCLSVCLPVTVCLCFCCPSVFLSVRSLSLFLYSCSCLFVWLLWLGKTENTANFKFISGDKCKDIRVIYNEAVKFCTMVSPANGRMSCPSAQCLKPLYKWREAVNSSEKFRVDCAFDPNNMEAVIQKYSSCIGKSCGYLVSSFLSLSGSWSRDMIGSVTDFNCFYSRVCEMQIPKGSPS